MSNIFLISDTHFGHLGVCKFLRDDGVTKLRPWNNAEEMDEALVANWNSVVRPCDKVYHLGDVAMSKKGLPILARLNGTKILIKGNHDNEKLSVYQQYFKDVRGSHQIDNFILSHIPIHPNSIARWCGGNIHGHLHSNRVMKCLGEDWYGDTMYKIDTRYYCVSVEQINYTPIAFESLKKMIKEQQ